MRDMTSAARAAISAEVPLRTVAVMLDFPGGVVRLNGSPQSIVIEGQEYFGVGSLGGISTVEESAELGASRLTLQLAGVPRDAVALSLTEAYQGRAGVVWEVPLHPVTHQVVTAPVIVFRGRMDQMLVKMGTTATVQVVLQSRLADWERPRLRRYTDEDQQRLHPGDRGFSFVTASTEKEIVWPAASFYSRK